MYCWRVSPVWPSVRIVDDSSTSEPAGTRRTPGPRTATRPTERPAADKAVEEPRTGELNQGLSEPTQMLSEPTQIVSVPTNIYRARRPVVALFLVLPAVAVALFLVRAFAISAFGSPFSAAGVIASSLALASLPLLVAGLYGLITGAAYGAEQFGFKVWARPPLAYLIVGISFVLGAAIAIR
jgi:hypothetical protein